MVSRRVRSRVLLRHGSHLAILTRMDPHVPGRRAAETPFDNIESAQEYVQLLGEAVDESIRDTADDLDACTSERQRDGLRLVDYKLRQLRTHLTASSRILNDLRTLRRLLLNQRTSGSVREQPAEGRPDHRRIR
jgi:hypothetical protein